MTDIMASIGTYESFRNFTSYVQFGDFSRDLQSYEQKLGKNFDCKKICIKMVQDIAIIFKML